ncbi:MAG TPA: RhuM family protein [Methanothrix sp.]|nr:RhuM family protein [Methanothrix sp.]
MPKRKSSSRKETLREPAAVYGGPGGEVVLYQAPDGTVQLDVRLERETIWLNQKQMALLFDTERSVITKHLRNIFQSGELEEKSNVQKMHIPGSDKPVAFYDLDVVISVGYRVNSKRGTQFRIWATQVLRDHILKGYTVNARRLEELKQTIKLVSTLADRRSLSSDEATALLRVVRDYTFALEVLDAYDHGRLPRPPDIPQAAVPISLEEARRMISAMRTQYGVSALFGQEQGDRLAGALAAIFQTADGREVYPTIEEKAAHLLYFLVKDHPFVDGNKRIGAALFLRFFEKNGLLYRSDGTPRMSEEALVALTLLVAESAPREKDTIVRLIAFLLQGRSEDLEKTL